MFEISKSVEKMGEQARGQSYDVKEQYDEDISVSRDINSKSIVVIVSPPEALVLDVPEAFTATDKSRKFR